MEVGANDKAAVPSTSASTPAAYSGTAGPDPSLSASTSAAAGAMALQPSQPPKRKAFLKKELHQTLMPVLEKLRLHDTEAVLFRQPVDPVALGIPRPVTLLTIKSKLDNGLYIDPWQFVDDMWLMFENACLYNSNTSQVYDYCMQLVEVFEAEVDEVMQQLGLCCSRYYVVCPRSVSCCCSRNRCLVNCDQVCSRYQKRCLHKVPFKPNIEALDWEPFVYCVDCGRKLHQICTLHLEVIWPKGFKCENCLKANAIRRTENNFTAKRLPSNVLAGFLENHVNTYLKSKVVGAGEVTIRVLHTADRIATVKPEVQSRFTGVPAGLPIRTKVVFAFEEVDGQDVCFFGMHVVECSESSLRHVYISCMESIHFFKSQQYRKAVHQEILVGYLAYARSLGYTRGHIGACPTDRSDGFPDTSPLEQKAAKLQMLHEWYGTMLADAITKGVVIDFKHIGQDVVEDSAEYPTGLPYFCRDLESSDPELGMMDAHQMLIVIRLQLPALNSLAPVADPDSCISCDAVLGQESFLALCREHSWEFCSLRRSAFSTMALLRELHTRRPGRGVVTCAKCSKNREPWMHCTACEDFCLYSPGLEKEVLGRRRLAAPSRRCGVELLVVPAAATPAAAGSEQALAAASAAECARRASCTAVVKCLPHVCHCTASDCSQLCQRIKLVVQHFQVCPLRESGSCNCPACSQLLGFALNHAEHCDEAECLVPLCRNTKRRRASSGPAPL